MKITQLAQRYAKALFELATEGKVQDKVFQDLRELDAMFTKDPEIANFLAHPLVKNSDRVKALKEALSGKGLAQETHSFLMLLAEKERMGVFGQIVAAYEQQSDKAHNVGRGVVRSAVALGPEERTRIEATVEKVLNKKAILTYKVDPTVIGGLIAQVGSYTFDDTITSHLSRMNDEIKRRTV